MTVSRAMTMPSTTRPPSDRTGAAVRVSAVVRGAAYLFVASIPFEMPGVALPLEVPTLTGFLFLAASLLHPTVCYRRFPAPVWFFGAFLWVFGLSVALNDVVHPTLAWRFFGNMAQLVGIFVVLTNVMADDRAFRGVLLAFAIACAVRAGMQLAGIAATRHAVWTGGMRVTVLGQNANLSAIILSGGLAVVVGLRTAASRFPSFGVLTWPIAALLAVAIVHTGSRGGLLCAAAGLMVLALGGRTLAARGRTLLLAIAGLAALGWLASTSPVMRGRLDRTTQEGHLAGREAIYPAALAMVRERPWLGWAPIDNQFEIARRIDDHEDPRRDAHNLVLELLTATGVAGAVPFLAGLALCIRAGWRARRGTAGLVPMALLAAALTGTISGTWIASKIVWLALTVAVAAGARVPSTGREVASCAA